MGNSKNRQKKLTYRTLIREAWIPIDTEFFTHSQGIVISLPLDHRREFLIGRAYPPVVPITDEISPDEGLQFLHSHSFCAVSSIDEFRLHPCPHTFASYIVMVVASIAVHALENVVFCSRPAICFTGVSHRQSGSQLP